MATIEIRTKLHDGIYRSSGGGQVRTRATFPASRAGWTKAALALDETRSDNIRCYGNIGAGRTWAVLVDGEDETTITQLLSLHLDDINAEASEPSSERRRMRALGVKTARQSAPATADEIRALAERFESGFEAFA